MVLAQQALAKMQDKGLTVDSLFAALQPNEQGVARLNSNDNAAPLAAATSEQAQLNVDTQAVQALLAELAEQALVLQPELPVNAEFADLMVPALIESMGLNFALIQESTDRVVLAQAATTTATDAGGAAGHQTHLALYAPHDPVPVSAR